MSTSPGPAAVDRGAIHFPLQPGERVLTICRKHWIFLYPRLLLYLVLGLAPVIVLAVLLSKTDGFHGTAKQIFEVVAAVWLVYWLVRMLFGWYRYSNDLWVITDQRIIDSTRTTPFNLKLSTADLANVQDMTIERRGIFPTVFDYGDVVCQTAADLQEFRLVGIHHPREVQALVDRERDRERQHASGNGPAQGPSSPPPATTT